MHLGKPTATALNKMEIQPHGFKQVKEIKISSVYNLGADPRAHDEIILGL